MLSDFEIRSKLRTIYMELSEEHDFHCPCNLQIVISKRLRSMNGCCETKGWLGVITNAKITMSKALLDEFGWERFEKTFRHEVAHLADLIIHNGRGHEYTFKCLCKAFGGSMNPTIAGSQFADCADTAYVKTIKKWKYTCPCGKQKIMARRMNKGKRGNKLYRCGRCKIHTLDTWKEERIG